MRWKIQILASLAMASAAILLYAAAQRIETGTFAFRNPLSGPAKLFLLIPLVLAGAAGFFVYRHTARQRKTQALLTIILTIFIALAVLVILSRLL